MPVLATVLRPYGLDLNVMMPYAIQGLALHMVSIAGLSVLALHRRRF
jgi:hypothetical protein